MRTMHVNITVVVNNKLHTPKCSQKDLWHTQRQPSGPVMFSIQMLPLGYIIHQHNMTFYCNTDDTQPFLSANNSDLKKLILSTVLIHCIILRWMNSFITVEFMMKTMTFTKTFCQKTSALFVCAELTRFLAVICSLASWRWFELLLECDGLEGISGCKDTSFFTLILSPIKANPRGYGKSRWVQVKDMTRNNKSTHQQRLKAGH